MLAPLELPLQRRDGREGAHRKLPGRASVCAGAGTLLKEPSIHRGHVHGPASQISRRRIRTDQANALAFHVRKALFALLSLNAATTSPHGRVHSILPPGWDWRQATRSPAARSFRPERADPAAGRRHFCAPSAHRHRARRLLQATFVAHRQGQGCDRHGPQDRSSVCAPTSGALWPPTR